MGNQLTLPTSSKKYGCEYHPSCLNCPEPTCLLDFKNPGVVVRNREIVKQFKEGKSIEELVKAFNLCKRTIRRILKEV